MHREGREVIERGGETKERRLYTKEREEEGKKGVEWRDGEPEDRRASVTEG